MEATTAIDPASTFGSPISVPTGAPADMLAGRETFWANPYRLPYALTRGVCELAVSDADIADAAARLERFAPFFERVFPETRATGGLIESPLVETPALQRELGRLAGAELPGRLLLKLDSHLAVAGSVKARGGIYEVLKHAEKVALAHGLLDGIDDDYAKLAEPAARSLFSGFTVQVGSTGNLGLSIGIMAAALGFRAVVHMSADARQWKKDLLRARGVEVREYAGDYAAAVRAGRELSDADPTSYFVDDERSRDLFCGYAVAAGRLRGQLDALDIAVDAGHPLLVYIPAGVGGAPGGISYGLKHLFGDAVRCFFCEPVQCPSVTLGIATQLFEKADVRAFGLSGATEADGLACPAPSGFVTRLMTNLLDGAFTVDDARLFDYLRLLYGCGDTFDGHPIEIEPSSCAALAGPLAFAASQAGDGVRARASDGAVARADVKTPAWTSVGAAVRAYCDANGLDDDALANATHIVWATGGALVPSDVREQYRTSFLRHEV